MISEFANMTALAGIYRNGEIKLDGQYASDGPVKVIVTFLEEPVAPSKKRLTFDDFSFAESRKALEGYNGSFSDALIEERRSEL